MIGQFIKQIGCKARVSVAVLLTFALVFGTVISAVALAKAPSQHTQVLSSSDVPHQSPDQNVGASDCPNCAQSVGIVAATQPLSSRVTVSVQVDLPPTLRIPQPKPATPPPRRIG